VRAVALAALLGACASAPRAEVVRVPLPASVAQADLKTAAGGSLRLVDLRGQVVLLDVWAAWCGPCRESLPAYARMQRDLGARGFSVVAVSVDQEESAVRDVLAREPVPFAVVLDPEGHVPAAMSVDAMPECFLIDRAGLVRLRHRGFTSGDEANLRAAIERLLAGG
jgi:peroxiredoxin